MRTILALISTAFASVDQGAKRIHVTLSQSATLQKAFKIVASNGNDTLFTHFNTVDAEDTAMTYYKAENEPPTTSGYSTCTFFGTDLYLTFERPFKISATGALTHPLSGHFTFLRCNGNSFAIPQLLQPADYWNSVTSRIDRVLLKSRRRFSFIPPLDCLIVGRQLNNPENPLNAHIAQKCRPRLYKQSDGRGQVEISQKIKDFASLQRSWSTIQEVYHNANIQKRMIEGVCEVRDTKSRAIYSAIPLSRLDIQEYETDDETDDEDETYDEDETEDEDQTEGEGTQESGKSEQATLSAPSVSESLVALEVTFGFRTFGVHVTLSPFLYPIFGFSADWCASLSIKPEVLIDYQKRHPLFRQTHLVSEHACHISDGLGRSITWLWTPEVVSKAVNEVPQDLQDRIDLLGTFPSEANGEEGYSLKLDTIRCQSLSFSPYDSVYAKALTLKINEFPGGVIRQEHPTRRGRAECPEMALLPIDFDLLCR